MPLTLSKHLALASLFACLVVACSTSPTTSDAEALDQNQTSEEAQFEVDTTDWTDDRRALEEQFWAWLQAGESLPEANAQGPAHLQGVIQEKGAAQQQLEGQFQPYIADSSAPEAAGWATLRSAQTYLHIGCELNEVEAPEGLNEEMRAAYDQIIADLVRPLLAQATTRLNSLNSPGAAPWSEDAAFLLRRLDPLTPQSCEATAEYWRP